MLCYVIVEIEVMCLKLNILYAKLVYTLLLNGL